MDVTLTTDELKHILIEWKKTGKIFGIHFIKRSNSELRTMSCRGCTKSSWDKTDSKPKQSSGKNHELVTVFDMNRKDYRSVPLEGIRQISMQGTTYHVTIRS